MMARVLVVHAPVHSGSEKSLLLCVTYLLT